MAITLKAHVSFPMTIVVATETMKFVAQARAEVRSVPAEKLAEKLKDANKLERAKLELFLSDKTDEQVVEWIYRSSLRQFIRDDLRKELCNDESTARIGDTRVIFEQKEVKPKWCATCQNTVPQPCGEGCQVMEVTPRV
ncbi:hypothetical protein [Pseudomonas sp.]|uniref:hypothetical protein n=1 Tax=Pseudomonas sp. TaxID=306 RepID=UPI002607EB3D|nr:hypothetical protein [Pseudomonas sp.]